MAEPVTVAIVTIECQGMRAEFRIPDGSAARMSWPLDVIEDGDGRKHLDDIYHLRIAADLPRSTFSGWQKVNG